MPWSSGNVDGDVTTGEETGGEVTTPRSANISSWCKGEDEKGKQGREVREDGRQGQGSGGHVKTRSGGDRSDFPKQSCRLTPAGARWAVGTYEGSLPPALPSASPSPVFAASP